MSRTCLFFFCAVAFACSDDDVTPPADAGTDAPTGPCRFVESGASGGDGSEARPHGSLLEALDAASAGDRICLGAGAFELPATFDTELSIEGAGATQTILSGALGCTTVSVVDAFDDVTRADVDVVMNVGASLGVSAVTIQGCAIGVYARDAAVDLTDVVFQDVQASLVLEGSAVGTVAASTLRTGDVAGTPAVLQQAVVQASPGATLRTSGSTTIDAGGGVFGVLARGGTVELEQTTLAGGASGVWIQDGITTLGPDVAFDDQSDVADVFGHNRIRGGQATLNGVRVSRPSEAGFIFENAEGTIERSSFTGIGRYGLVLFGSEVDVGAGVEIDAIGERAAVYIGQEGEDGEPSTLSVNGGLTTTTSSDLLTHVYIASGSLLNAAGTINMSGGAVGVFAADSSAVLDGAVVADQVQNAVVARGTGTVVARSLAVTNALTGVAALDGAQATVTDSAFADVGVGVLATDRSLLTLERVRVQRATQRGVSFSGIGAAEASTLIDVTVEDTDDVGVQVQGFHRVQISGGLIQGSRRGGIEASGGSTVDVSGIEIRANERMGVAFYDAQGSVMESTFGGTIPQGGRADEIRIVAAEGTPREVAIGTLQFDLDVVRDCTGAGCTVMIANGDDAVGIVTPNCIRESAPEAATFTTVEENGGTFMLVGPSAWSAVLAGRVVDIGLSSGSATPVVSAPIPDDPVRPPPAPR